MDSSVDTRGWRLQCLSPEGVPQRVKKRGPHLERCAYCGHPSHLTWWTRKFYSVLQHEIVMTAPRSRNIDKPKFTFKMPFGLVPIKVLMFFFFFYLGAECFVSKQHWYRHASSVSSILTCRLIFLFQKNWMIRWWRLLSAWTRTNGRRTMSPLGPREKEVIIYHAWMSLDFCVLRFEVPILCFGKHLGTIEVTNRVLC